jgi:two-component system, NarL family, sensor histidine kinase DesK
MTTSLIDPWPVRLTPPIAPRPRLPWPQSIRIRSGAILLGHLESSRSAELATTAGVALCVVMTVSHIGDIVTRPPGTGTQGLWALAAATCYLPLHVRHVWYAAHATRPPRGAWTLAAMAAIVLGVLPLAGGNWVMEFSWLAVSVLIVVRRPWSVLIVIGLFAVAEPVSRLFGEPDNLATWNAISAGCRCALLIVLVWMAATLRRLRAARQDLAAAAVAQERLRIDGELGLTLGIALESIANRGARAATQLGADPALLEAALRALIEDSRMTLAEARRMIRGYQQGSLRAELDSAVALLAAAGIEARLVLARADVADTAEEAPRAALRAGLARALRADPPPRACRIMVTRDGGQTRVALYLERDRQDGVAA